MAWLPLLLLLLVAGALLVGAVLILTALAILRPPRMTDAKALWVLRRLSPAELNLAFEDMPFEVRDAGGRPLRLAAWWIPATGSDRCVVMVHGYADAKVGVIAWAPVFHELGWNVLAIDMRGHGASQGAWCTAGYQERHDLSQAIDLLRQRLPGQTRQVILFGASMGAAVAAATASQRADLQGLIMDSPVPDPVQAMLQHLDDAGPVGRRLGRLAIAMAQRLGRCNFGQVRATELVATTRCPVLLILCGLDVYLQPDGIARFEQALRQNPHAKSTLWTVADSGHLMALVADPMEYRRRVRQFLSQTGEPSA